MKGGWGRGDWSCLNLHLLKSYFVATFGASLSPSVTVGIINFWVSWKRMIMVLGCRLHEAWSNCSPQFCKHLNSVKEHTTFCATTQPQGDTNVHSTKILKKKIVNTQQLGSWKLPTKTNGYIFTFVQSDIMRGGVFNLHQYNGVSTGFRIWYREWCTVSMLLFKCAGCRIPNAHFRRWCECERSTCAA